MEWDAETPHLERIPRIDLHARRSGARRALFQRSRRSLALLAATLATLLFLALPLTASCFQKQAVLRATRAAAARDGAEKMRIEKTSVTATARLETSRRLERSRERRLAWRSVLTSLASCLPPDAYLDNLELRGESGRVTIQLRGAALSAREAHRFADTLLQSRSVLRVRLSETTSDTSIGPSGLRFSLEATADLANDTSAR